MTTDAAMIFLHVFSIIIWIGGMAMMRCVVYPSLNSLPNDEVKTAQKINVMKRFIFVASPFILILMGTGIYLMSSFQGNMNVHIKEAIWLVMVLNFVFMYLQVKKAEKTVKENQDFAKAQKQLSIITNFLIPATILPGMGAIILGIMLKMGGGF